MENQTEDIKTLKKLARKSKNTQQRRQYDNVRLYLEGQVKPEIAEVKDFINNKESSLN